jgi:hypothetical protein
MSTAAATTPKIPQAQLDWLSKLVDAKADENLAKKNELFDGVTARLNSRVGEIRDGMSFTMERIDDPAAVAAMKRALGIQSKMKSLTGTGDAMKEIDTHEDLSKLKAISAADISKAQRALEVVSNASEEARTRLREMRFEEAGLKDKDKRQKIEEAVEERKKARAGGKAVPKIPEGLDEKDIKKVEELEERVNAEVAEEIWTPLVRQGVLPENFVPENYSNVRRTFDAASKSYNERLEEYSKGLDDNAELLRKLGVAKDVLDKAGTLVGNIADAVPGDIAKHVKTAGEVFQVVNAAAFKSAEMGVQQKKWYEIAETGATGLADACAKAIPDPAIATIVSSAIKGGAGGGKFVLGITKKDPEAALKAFSDAVSNGFSIASSATGDTSWDMYGKIATNVILQGGKGSKLFKAIKDGEGIEDAAKEFIDQSSAALNAALAPVIQATVADQKTAGNITQGVNIGTDLAGGIVKAAMSKDKDAALKAITGAAKSCCETYIEPSDLGKSIAGLVETGLNTGAALYKNATEKDLNAIAKTLLSAVSDSLSAVSNMPALADKKTFLEAASKDIKLGDQAKELAAAIISRDPGKIDKAATAFFTAFSDSVASHLPSNASSSDDSSDGSDDSDDSGSDDDAGDEGDDNSVADKAKELDEEVVESLRSTIAKANAVLKDPTATKDQKDKATEAIAKASKELVERKTMESDLEAESKAFAAKLSRTFEGNDDPDFEGEDPRTLQELILQIQKDRKIFELVEKLSSLPLQVAAKFFPPSAAAMDFKTFTFEVMKSVTHTKQLLEWMDNAGDARNAVSVQAHAMLSRVHCENRQLLEHSMKAALALTAAIGNVLAVAGATAAPAGVAMAAAARAGQTGMEIVKTIVDEAEAAKAWSLYREAMQNPRNRKKVRQAIQSNPTLAKYALAWGALQGGDAIAKNAVKKCGLTDAILAKESANVKEVQQYLEELFKEDIVVLRAIPVKKGWYPDKTPTLSLRSWSAFYAAAVDKAKLKPGTGGAVGKAFTDLEMRETNFKSAQDELKFAKQLVDRQTVEARKAAGKAVAEKISAKDLEPGAKVAEIAPPPDSPALKKAAARLGRARKSVQANKQALLGALDGVRSAALKFEPKDTDGKDHVDMREYLDALAAQAELRARELKGEEVAIDTAAA